MSDDYELNEMYVGGKFKKKNDESGRVIAGIVVFLVIVAMIGSCSKGRGAECGSGIHAQPSIVLTEERTPIAGGDFLLSSPSQSER